MSKDNKIISINAGKRNAWMDGLKALSCLQVFTNHFICTFYPAYFFSGDQMSHANGLERKLAYSFLAKLLDAHVYLALFFLLSGIFMCMKIMNIKNPKEKMSQIIVGRYFRLVIPIVPVSVVILIMSRLGCFTNALAAKVTGSEWLTNFYNRSIGVIEAFASVFIKTMFFGDDTLSTAYWMLSQMFLGSLLAILLGMIYWQFGRKAIVIYGFVFLAILPRHDYLQVFVLGAMFAWAMKEDIMDVLKRADRSGGLANAVGIICIVLSHIVGAYPKELEPMGIYKLMNIGFVEVIYALAACLLLFGVYNVTFVQRILSARAFSALGNVCYDFYLIHIPVLFSIGTGLMLLLDSRGIDYNISAAFVYVIVLAIIIALSFIYNRFELWLTKSAEDRIVRFLNE